MAEPKSVLDTIRLVRGFTSGQAVERVKRIDREALETSVQQLPFGKRTFPTVTAPGYATPLFRDAGSILSDIRRRKRQTVLPFFTDPETGKEDRSQGSIFSMVPTRVSGQVNPPQAFPAGVAEEFVSEGPLDRIVGEDTLQIEQAKRARKRDEKIRAKMGSTPTGLVSRILGKLFN